MDKKKKNILIIACVIAAVLIALVLILYFLLYNKSEDKAMGNVDDLNNPAYIAEMNNQKTNTNKAEEIEKGQLVDSSINERLTAKISEKVNLYNGVKVDSVKVYKTGSSSGSADSSSLNQESIYNNIDNTPGVIVNDNENVNVIIDLKLTSNGNDMETVRRNMETNANDLAVSIANEKPNIMTAIVNFTLDNNVNAKASFTFERSGNNMFLQEFTLLSEFN